MQAPITFAIAGFGDRGSTYASMQQLFPDRMKVVAVADLDPRKVEKARQLYDIPAEHCFASAEEMLARDRLADVMVVSTMDRQHVGHAIPALERGYHVVLEKPISPDLAQCREILEVSRRCPGQVIVCHVLRYTPFYNTVKDLLDSGAIGDLVNIIASENVGYWHQAHSFVRGNWRNSAQTSPMILQKSCHDLDIFTWLTGKRCISLSSVGSNTLFRPENAPTGAPLRCLDGCPVRESCIFDAEKIYVTDPMTGITHRNDNWITSVLSPENTLESTYAALREGPYGRCVYHCDNDVVDHQQTTLLLEDGATVSFSMCAFSQDCYRTFRAMGTQGELEGDTKSNLIRVKRFGQGEQVIDVKAAARDLKGHGGGDSGIIADFLDMLLEGRAPTQRTTTLEHSMESHYLALAAEESRLRGGQVISIEAFRTANS